MYEWTKGFERINVPHSQMWKRRIGARNGPATTMWRPEADALLARPSPGHLQERPLKQHDPSPCRRWASRHLPEQRRAAHPGKCSLAVSPFPASATSASRGHRPPARLWEARARLRSWIRSASGLPLCSEVLSPVLRRALRPLPGRGGESRTVAAVRAEAGVEPGVPPRW